MCLCDCMDVSSPGVLHTTQPACVKESVSECLEEAVLTDSMQVFFPDRQFLHSHSHSVGDTEVEKAPFYLLSRSCVVMYDL